jgi:hypothetical protein
MQSSAEENWKHFSSDEATEEANTIDNELIPEGFFRFMPGHYVAIAEDEEVDAHGTRPSDRNPLRYNPLIFFKPTDIIRHPHTNRFGDKEDVSFYCLNDVPVENLAHEYPCANQVTINQPFCDDCKKERGW